MIARLNTFNDAGVNLVVRPFEVGDTPNLCALFARPPGHEWDADLERLLIVDQGDCIVGHVAWGVPHATVSALAETGHSPVSAAIDMLEIQQLFVAESHRRCGFGVRLLNAAIDAIHAADCAPVLACQMDNSAALGLYLSEGFVVGGRFVLSRAGGFYSMIQGIHNG